MGYFVGLGVVEGIINRYSILSYEVGQLLNQYVVIKCCFNKIHIYKYKFV